MSYIFISYTRRGNTRFARLVSQRLNALGVETWLAAEKLKAAHESGVTAGEITQINSAVANSSAVLVLWSTTSISRPYVIGEVNRVYDDSNPIGSKKNATRLVQAIIDKMDKNRIPAPFGQRNSHRIVELKSNNSPVEWPALLAEIGGYLGRPGLAELDALLVADDPTHAHTVEAIASWCRKYSSDPMAKPLWQRVENHHRSKFNAQRTAFVKRRDDYLETFKNKTDDAVVAFNSKFDSFMNKYWSVNTVLPPDPSEFWRSAKARATPLETMRRLITSSRKTPTVWLPHEVDEQLREQQNKSATEMQEQERASEAEIQKLRSRLDAKLRETRKSAEKQETANQKLKDKNRDLQDEVKRLETSLRKKGFWNWFNFCMSLILYALVFLVASQNWDELSALLASFFDTSQ